MDFISQIAWQGILFQFVSNEMKVHHICGKPSPHLWQAFTTFVASLLVFHQGCTDYYASELLQFGEPAARAVGR